MESSAQRRVVRFGMFEADLSNRRLTKDGFRIRLQDQPFQVLALLLDRQGQVVTREELKERLWPGDTFVEFDTGLNTAIKKLRAALLDSAENPRFVETVPRVGYRFLASAAVSSPALTTAKEQVTPGALNPGATDPDLRSESPGIGVTHASRRRLGLVAVAIVALVIAGIGFVIRLRNKRAVSAAPLASIQSIAVLPLLNVSADSSQEYFADGMTDEIITDLAKLAGPKVISRTSAMQYKRTGKAIPEIARELNVGAVLEGSVERSADRMRVRVQLIDAATDRHLWAEAYDRRVSDVLLLEAELAQDIARQIAIRLTPQQQENLASHRPMNPQAFQDYLQGRHYWALRTKESLSKAVDYFDRAIREDSSDARSYAGLAQCYIVLPMLTQVTQAEAYPKARDAATKALLLDDSLAEAHLSIAEVRLYLDWDFVGAEDEFKKTLALNPNYSTGHQWYGEFLSLMGRHAEATEELQTALTLDPLSPVVHLQFGNTLQQARQYDKALDQYNDALRLDPRFYAPYEAMSWIYRRQGRMAESIPPLQTAVQLYAKPDLTVLVEGLPAAYSAGGKKGYLRQSLRIHDHYARPAYYLARDYMDLGDRDAGFAALHKALRNRDTELLWVLVDPEMDPLRSDPRLQDLMRLIGYPQASPRPDLAEAGVPR